jgi:hypothetical protein
MSLLSWDNQLASTSARRVRNKISVDISACVTHRYGDRVPGTSSALPATTAWSVTAVRGLSWGVPRGLFWGLLPAPLPPPPLTGIVLFGPPREEIPEEVPGSEGGRGAGVEQGREPGEEDVELRERG